MVRSDFTRAQTAALLGGLLLLAACQKPAGEATSATDAVATPAVAVTTTASGAPKRADGYWESTSYGASGSQMGKQFLCVGNGSEAKQSLFDELMSAGNCGKHDFTRTASGWNFDIACGSGDYLMTSVGSISGNFADSYTVDQTAGEGKIKLKGSIKGKNLGACPQGVKAGDMLDAGGDKLVNVLE